MYRWRCIRQQKEAPEEEAVQEIPQSKPEPAKQQGVGLSWSFGSNTQSQNVGFGSWGFGNSLSGNSDIMGLLSQMENKSNKNTIAKKEKVSGIPSNSLKDNSKDNSKDIPDDIPEGIPITDKSRVCFDEYFIDVLY